MKKYILLASTLFMGVFTSQGQEESCSATFINLESGVNLSQFNFSNSQVESAFKNGDYSPSQHQAVALGFDVVNGLNLILGVAYDKHQLIGQPIDMINSKLSYDINYVSASAGFEFIFPLQDKVSLLASGGMASNYLLSGFQHLGSATYDLEDTDFQKTSYSYTVGAGLLYQCTDVTGIYLKYDYKNSLDMDEKDPNDTYAITSYMYSIGVRFNLAN